MGLTLGHTPRATVPIQGSTPLGTEPGTWELWTRGIIIITIIFTKYPETSREELPRAAMHAEEPLRNLGSIPIESGLSSCSSGPSTRVPLGETWGGLLHGAPQEGRPCQPLVWKEAHA